MELYPGIEIVYGEPALYLRDFDALVIADLHLGFEEVSAEHGLFLPRVQLKKLIKKVEKLLNLSGASKVIINGDVKHCFSKLTYQERSEVSEFIKFLRDKGLEVYITRGNHDNYISLILSKYDIPLYEYMLINDILLIHGHEYYPMATSHVKIIIIGHEHPSISIRDELGHVTKLSCFLKVPLKTGQELVIIPALSIYALGTRVTIMRENYLSPIVRDLGILEEAIPYVISEEGVALELPPLKDIHELIG